MMRHIRRNFALRGRTIESRSFKNLASRLSVDDGKTDSSLRKLEVWLSGTVVLAAMGALYLLTLQRHVAGRGQYLEDVDEVQVVLNIGGTLHATGYPLYTGLGVGFVRVLRWLGVTPATAASTYSMAWSLIALALIYWLAVRMTSNSAISGGIVLVVGTSRAFWVHSVIAEVYSMNAALTTAILLLALSNKEWSLRRFAALSLLVGTAVAHHRITVLLLPALTLYVAPEVRKAGIRAPKNIALAALSFAVGFLPYLYLPIRAWRGAPWVYDSPATWKGFLDQFLATEYGWTRAPASNLPMLGPRFTEILHLLAGETTPLLLILASISVVHLVSQPSSRRLGYMLFLVAGTSIGYQALIGGIEPSATLMPITMIVALLSGLLLARLGRNLPQILTATALVAMAVFLGLVNYPVVQRTTTQKSGLEFIEAATHVPSGKQSYFMAPWGTDYFAAGYALYVTGELTGIHLVDHNADLASIIHQGDHLYVHPNAFHVFPHEWWEERLGSVHLSSAAPGVISISDQPIVSPTTAGGIALGNGVEFLDYRISYNPQTRDLVVTVWWRAARKLKEDYSVYIHVLDKTTIQGSADIVAQGDQCHPVYGHYPTSRWIPGEIVRDDYIVVLPEQTQPCLVTLGMYLVVETPEHYRNFGNITLELSPHWPACTHCLATE